MFSFGSVMNVFKSFSKRLPGKILAPIAAVVGAFEIVNGVADVFKDSKANAKLAGTLLGCSLAIREPFLTQSVSLIGFSLGCQVIKTCLKTLYKLKAFDVI